MRSKAHRIGIRQRQAAPVRRVLALALLMMLASLAELFQPVGDGRPAAAVRAEPPAVHEEVAVLRPEAVERLAGENPSVAPLRRLVEFLAPVAAIITVNKQDLRKKKATSLFANA
jgi:hypothetical protein